MEKTPIDNCFTILFTPDIEWLKNALKLAEEKRTVKIAVVITSADTELMYKTRTNIDNLERWVCCTDTTKEW